MECDRLEALVCSHEVFLFLEKQFGLDGPMRQQVMDVGQNCSKRLMFPLPKGGGTQKKVTVALSTVPNVYFI